MNDETLKEEIEQALKKDFNNLLVKEFTTDWKVQRLKIGLDIEVMDFDNLMQLIKEDRERVVKEARIDELKNIVSPARTNKQKHLGVAYLVEDRLAELSNPTQTKKTK